MRGITAVVPVKPECGHKTRLAGVLSARERSLLFNAMLEDVLEVLCGCAELGGMLLVGSSHRAGALAERYGAQLLVDDGRGGLNGALCRASTHLCAQDAEGILVLPGDVPLVKSADIHEIVERHEPAHNAVIVPDRNAQGTNALLVSPPDLLSFQYGSRSFCRHVELLRSLDRIPVTLSLPRLALDIDTPEDLLLLEGASGRTGRLLAASGWLQRCRTETWPRGERSKKET